jgi:Tfp pilus assembly PilM family ATPase
MRLRKNITRKHVIYWADDEIRMAVIGLEAGQAIMVHHAVFDSRGPNADVESALRDFLKKTRTASQAWIPVVSQSNVLWKWITVPSHDENEIGQMVRLSMKTAVWDGSEFVLAHHIIEKQPDGHSRVRVGIIHQNVLEKYWDTLNAAGIKFDKWAVSSVVVKGLKDSMQGAA